MCHHTTSRAWLPIAAVAVLVFFASCSQRDARNWPAVSEGSLTHHFVLKSGEVWKFSVNDRNGNPLYLFDSRFNAGEHESPDFNFSGVFDCRLYSPEDREYSNYLQNVKVSTRDWESDGRFLGSELIGLAGAGPSRRIVQVCMVRGMRIKMEISNVTIRQADEKTSIISMDFLISFVNDDAAVSPISVTEK